MSTEASLKATIEQALRQVVPPGESRDVCALGYVQNVAHCDGVVRVTYRLPPQAAGGEAQRAVEAATRRALGGLAAVREAHVEFQLVPSPPTGVLPGVRHVIAVGAGKGGVGKSTVAVLAAVGLQRLGHRVGLLDADVYGPSLPKLTGTEDAAPTVDEGGRVIPPQFDGIKLLSMGHLVPPEQAVIWRGPMAQKYVKEFLERGEWGELDCLIVDLPPGTGDIPLTLAQSIPLTGAVVVCTPQDVALLEAVKALRMYQKLGVEPLGLVENMSYYLCPHCGQREPIFGAGGVARVAAELGVPFLGGIPLHLRLREAGDAGRPLAAFVEAEGYVREALEHVVRGLWQAIESRGARRKSLPQLKIHD